MKKKVLPVLIAMIATIPFSVMAQKENLKKAKLLLGNTEKVAEGRALLDSAKINAETSADAYTWFLAGKLESEAYKKNRQRLMVDPNLAIDKSQLAEQLKRMTENWGKALALDSIPDSKGKIKRRYTKEIRATLSELQDDIFSLGVHFLSTKQYYPEEYEIFMTYSRLPQTGISMPDSLITKATFNAALAAYSSGNYAQAAEAFHKTRQHGDNRKEIYVYEIASWRGMLQDGSVTEAKARGMISEISLEGHRAYGKEHPAFLRNYVNMELLNDSCTAAVKVLEEEMKHDKENGQLAGMLARLYEHSKDTQKAMAAYRVAAADEDADPEVLKTGARLLYSEGYDIWRTLEGKSKEVEENRKMLIEEYFTPAHEMALKAQKANPEDTDLSALIENIDFVLVTGF